MCYTTRPFRILMLGLVLSSALAASAQGALRPHPSLTSPRFASATETVIYSFLSGADGALSYAPLIADSHGALYGTTIHGGIPSGGYGTVFKLTPSGSGYSESVLYAFQGGYDGAYPFAGVIADKRGALYGTTYTGGPSGGGSVYKLTHSHSGYTKTILYGFMGGSDGATPQGTLYMDGAGNLFGTKHRTVELRGRASCSGNSHRRALRRVTRFGSSTVFKVATTLRIRSTVHWLPMPTARCMARPRTAEARRTGAQCISWPLPAPRIRNRLSALSHIPTAAIRSVGSRSMRAAACMGRPRKAVPQTPERFSD